MQVRDPAEADQRDRTISWALLAVVLMITLIAGTFGRVLVEIEKDLDEYHLAVVERRQGCQSP